MYTANRLRRWALTLLGYDFEIECRSTSKFEQVDVSSLIADQETEKEDIIIAEVYIEDDVKNIFSDAVRALSIKAKMIADATKTDNELQSLFHAIQDEWSENSKKKLPQFYSRRESLSQINSCLMSADRVVIPEALRAKVLQQLHSGHPGVVGMEALARSCVYWPEIGQEIERAVRQCSNCMKAAKAPVKTDLVSLKCPERPWERLHIDYAGPFKGHYFLVVVNAIFKWPEISITDTITTDKTISLLQQSFAQLSMLWSRNFGR